jgi:hypothetical protein
MEALIKALVLFVVALILGILLSWPAMMLWNGCLVPAVTFAKPIGWMQAWGLMILFNLMFKSTNYNSND